MRRKIEVISECGINHNGDMSIAEGMIVQSKRCGADVAKFQLFNAEKLIDTNPTLPDYNKEWVRKTELSKDDLALLSKACKKHNIEFMSSVFSPELVEWLEDVGVKRYKIPKFLSTDEKLCEKVLSTGKEVIVSSDLHNKIFRRYCHRVKYLYCVPDYPTDLEDVNVSYHLFDDYYGFSDHTIGISAAIYAMSLGARIIENHFTLGSVMRGPDHILSANVPELRTLCKMRDDIEILRRRVR